MAETKSKYLQKIYQNVLTSSSQPDIELWHATEGGREWLELRQREGADTPASVIRLSVDSLPALITALGQQLDYLRPALSSGFVGGPVKWKNRVRD